MRVDRWPGDAGMSKGARELQDLINLIDKTPGWTVSELTTAWHVHPPLSQEHLSVKKQPVIQASHLRNIGKDLERLGWTEETAKAAIREESRTRTAAARERAEKKTRAMAEQALGAPTAGRSRTSRPSAQVSMPLYEAATIGDASHLPPGPLGTDEIYSIDNVLLTPELATKFLDTNIENNRQASKTTRSDMAADIVAGRWKRNGDRVRFARVKDARGQWVHRLIDGQKRCHAVIEAGIGIPVDLIYNLDRDAFPTIDIQQSRTGGQVLYMRGITNPLGIAAGIKVVWMYDTRPEGSWSVRVTNPHLNDLYDGDPEGWQSAGRYTHNLMHKADRGLFAQRVVFGAYYICRREYPINPRLDEFFDTLVLGLDLKETSDPRFQVRKIFARERDDRVRKRTKRHLALIIKAYNNFMTGSEARVRWKDDESMPAPVMGG